MQIYSEGLSSSSVLHKLWPACDSDGQLDSLTNMKQNIAIAPSGLLQYSVISMVADKGKRKMARQCKSRNVQTKNVQTPKTNAT